MAKVYENFTSTKEKLSFLPFFPAPRGKEQEENALEFYESAY